MGMSAVQFKILPTDLDVDLSVLTEECKKVITGMGGIISNVEENEIAFGLKALIISFAYPEEKEIDEVGNFLSEVDGVSSASMIDYRRAFG